MIGYMRERRENLEIDIGKENYCKKSEFLSSKNEYINEPKHFVTEAWRIEENMVGQDWLIKIYEKYMYGIETELSDKGCFEYNHVKYIQLSKEFKSRGQITTYVNDNRKELARK